MLHPAKKLVPIVKEKNGTIFPGMDTMPGGGVFWWWPTPPHDAALMGGGGGSYWELVIKGINYSKNVTKNGVPKSVGGVGKNFSN